MHGNVPHAENPLGGAQEKAAPPGAYEMETTADAQDEDAQRSE
jgi:hypothetical protein